MATGKRSQRCLITRSWVAQIPEYLWNWSLTLCRESHGRRSLVTSSSHSAGWFPACFLLSCLAQPQSHRKAHSPRLHLFFRVGLLFGPNPRLSQAIPHYHLSLVFAHHFCHFYEAAEFMLCCTLRTYLCSEMLATLAAWWKDTAAGFLREVSEIFCSFSSLPLSAHSDVDMSFTNCSALPAYVCESHNWLDTTTVQTSTQHIMRRFPLKHIDSKQYSCQGVHSEGSVLGSLECGSQMSPIVLGDLRQVVKWNQME